MKKSSTIPTHTPGKSKSVVITRQGEVMLIERELKAMCLVMGARSPCLKMQLKEEGTKK
jgi:hypothetical protein